MAVYAPRLSSKLAKGLLGVNMAVTLRAGPSRHILESTSRSAAGVWAGLSRVGHFHSASTAPKTQEAGQDAAPLATSLDEYEPVEAPPSKNGGRLSSLPVTFHDISTAHYRIRKGIVNTQCKHSTALSELTGMNIYHKNDYRQVTGSFKERGARNALLLLSEEERKRGVIAASAGNHALALAYHGQLLNIPVTCVMPTTAPMTKIARCRGYGARVVLEGVHILAAREKAREMETKENLKYINGFDDAEIIAGAGTMGIEILQEVPDMDAIVVPIGGGGLIAGIGVAIKTLKPDVEVIGAEPLYCASYTAALKAGKPVDVDMRYTLADGLAVPKVGERAFSVAKEVVDRTVTIPEKQIALSILRVVELQKAILEGGGASGLAAVLDGQLEHLKGKNVVLPFCGANIDITMLGRVIERGLAADGRLVRFSVTVPDRPGGIAKLTELLADVGASIKKIEHERAWLQTSLTDVRVIVQAETISADHALEVYNALKNNNYVVEWG